MAIEIKGSEHPYIVLSIVALKCAYIVGVAWYLYSYFGG